MIGLVLSGSPALHASLIIWESKATYAVDREPLTRAFKTTGLIAHLGHEA